MGPTKCVDVPCNLPDVLRVGEGVLLYNKEQLFFWPDSADIRSVFVSPDGQVRPFMQPVSFPDRVLV